MQVIKKGTAVIITAASVIVNEHEYQALLQLPEREEGMILAVGSPAVIVDVTYQKNSDIPAYVVAQNNILFVVESDAFEVAETATKEQYHEFFFNRFSREVPNLKMMFAHEAGMNAPEE